MKAIVLNTMASLAQRNRLAGVSTRLLPATISFAGNINLHDLMRTGNDRADAISVSSKLPKQPPLPLAAVLG
jgi:hypothetical protein